MDYQVRQPVHLRKPLYRLLGDLVFFAVGITALFMVTEQLLAISTGWRPFVAALPGLGLSGMLVVIYRYIRHNDELEKRLGTQALAVGAIGGLVTLLVSVSRAAIGGYAELHGGVVMAVMAVCFIVSALILNWRHR
jgi:hypothetical protein